MAKVYVCPAHPEKNYTSWRKFRGHWSTQHRGEECPDRETFVQEVEKAEIQEAKKELRENPVNPAKDETEVGTGAKTQSPLVALLETGLPEEGVPRLQAILTVHGVDESTMFQILALFQLNPAYQQNPINLHYLLTAKLPRKFHTSIPMIVNEFSNQTESSPLGGIGGMMMPGVTGQMIPPYLQGGFGGMNPYMMYNPYSMMPPRRGPIGGGDEEEGGSRRRRSSEDEDPMTKTIALMGAFMDVVQKMTGGKSDETTKLSEDLRASYEGRSTTLAETIGSTNKEKNEIMEKFNSTINAMEENHRKEMDEVKELLHQAQMAKLEEKISTLEEQKTAEQTSGLGDLLKEAGEGVGTQAEGIRKSVENGVNKMADLAIKVAESASKPATPQPIQREGVNQEPKRDLSNAAALIEAETAVVQLADKLK